MNNTGLLSADQREIINITKLSCGGVGLFGSISLFVCVLYSIFSKKKELGIFSVEFLIRFYPNILVICLAFSNFFAILTFMLDGLNGTVNNKVYCVVIGFFGQLFQPASFLWISCISYSLFRLLHIIKRLEYEYQVKVQLIAHLIAYLLISWFLPTIGAIILVIIGGVGSTVYDMDSKCWIQSTSEALPIIFFDVPLFLAFIFNALVFLIMLKNNIREHMWKELSFYIGVFILVEIFPFIGTLISIFKVKGQVNFIITECAAITYPIQGIINFIIWIAINTKIPRWVINEEDTDSVIVLLSNNKRPVSSFTLFNHKAFVWTKLSDL